MMRFSVFLLVFALFAAKSTAQTDLIAIENTSGGGVALQNTVVEIQQPNLPAVALPAVSQCSFDPSLVASLPASADCFVKPSNNSNPMNGVSTFDLVLISKHILATQTFTSPWQWFAADINKSGTVSVTDIVELRKLILGSITTLQSNQSWRFYTKTCEFPNAPSPSGALNCFQQIPCPQALTAANDFIAIKIGDLNGNATAMSNCFWQPEVDDRSPLEPFQIAVEDRFFEKGELFEVLFSLEKNESEAAAFQFSLEHDGLEIVEILAEKGLPTDHFGLFKSEKLLTASWIETDGEPVFSLKMRAEKAGRLADFLKISDRKTRSEGYSSDGQPRLLQLNFETSKSQKPGLQLFPAEPNPFDESTRVRFFSTEKEVVATVFDAAGRIVFSKKMLAPNSFSGGETSFQLFKNDLPASGFYLLKIETPSGSATQKLILNR